MKTISSVMAAGVSQEWNIPPSKLFALLETVSAVDVELFSVDGRSVELAEGVESGYQEKADYTDEKIGRVKITSSTAQNVKWGYSSRNVENKKVTSTVSVIDGSVERSKTNSAYFAFGIDANLAGNYSHVQLWNPSANTKRLVVNSLAGYQLSGSIERVVFYKYNTQLGSVDPTYGEVNKSFGSSGASGAEVRLFTDATGVLGDVLLLAWQDDKKLVEFKLQEPIILNPGEGILVRGAIVNASIAASFQYYSENI